MNETRKTYTYCGKVYTAVLVASCSGRNYKNFNSENTKAKNNEK